MPGPHVDPFAGASPIEIIRPLGDDEYRRAALIMADQCLAEKGSRDELLEVLGMIGYPGVETAAREAEARLQPSRNVPDPESYPLCRKGLHRLTPDNRYTHSRGAARSVTTGCRPCRNDTARKRVAS